MNSRISTRVKAKGFTLIELSVVLCVLIALLSFGFGVSGAVTKWKKGRDASETLRTVYTAQRLYLADNPTTPVASLTQPLLLPYIPGGPATFPTSRTLEGVPLFVHVNVSPPQFTTTAGGVAGVAYDPSGSSTDSLWDVGE